MKLCLNSLGCPDWSAERLLDTASELGCQAIEIRGLDGRLEISDIRELSESGAQSFRDALKKRGLSASGLGSSAAFHSESLLKSSENEVKEALVAAMRVNAGFVRVFGNNIPSNECETDVLERVARALRGLCELSEQMANNCTAPNILLEAHGDFNTVKRLKYVCERVEHKKFGIIWDVAHVDRAIGGAKDAINDFFFELKPYIRHFHIKDHKRDVNGYTLCSLGKGDIPIGYIVRLALDNGFDGYFSLELEKKWHPELPEPETEFPHFAEYMRSLQ